VAAQFDGPFVRGHVLPVCRLLCFLFLFCCLRRDSLFFRTLQFVDASLQGGKLVVEGARWPLVFQCSEARRFGDQPLAFFVLFFSLVLQPLGTQAIIGIFSER
jgi:hypothetical protein